jgi:hypothetical protein
VGFIPHAFVLFKSVTSTVLISRCQDVGILPHISGTRRKAILNIKDPGIITGLDMFPPSDRRELHT